MKKKNSAYHFHTCGNHRWRHEGTRESCNLSTHAHCGFSRANDLKICVKSEGHKVAALAPRFTAEVSENGYALYYKGKRFLKAGLKAAEIKAKRPYQTRKKAERTFRYDANTLIETLDNGEGSPKLWAKLRKIDKELAA